MALRIVLVIAIVVYTFIISMAIRERILHKEQLEQFQMTHATHIGACIKCMTCYQCELPIGVRLKYEFSQEF